MAQLERLGKQLTMRPSISIPLALVTAFLAGCYTSQTAPDYASQVNTGFTKAEKDPHPAAAAAEQNETMARLWADVPEYVASMRDERKYKKMPRLLSSTVPAYPLIPLLANVKATVVVSFIIDSTGAVKAARVLESSDSRFDQSALAAVLKWKFLPAEYDDGPTIAVSAVPLAFDGKK